MLQSRWRNKKGREREGRVGGEEGEEEEEVSRVAVADYYGTPT